MKNKRDAYKEENKFRYKTALIILFVVFLGVILYASFSGTNFGNLGITGGLIGTGNSDESVNFEAELNIDSLELDGVFEEVVFTSVSNNKINIEKLSPTINNAEVILKNFSGEIIFGPDKIKELKGDAENILVEKSGANLSFSDSNHDVEINNFEYNDLKISGIYLRKIEKIVSGVIDISGTSSNVKDKVLLIKKFEGVINSKGSNSTIDLSGVVEKVKIGDSDFSLSFD